MSSTDPAAEEDLANSSYHLRNRLVFRHINSRNRTGSTWEGLRNASEQELSELDKALYEDNQGSPKRSGSEPNLKTKHVTFGDKEEIKQRRGNLLKELGAKLKKAISPEKSKAVSKEAIKPAIKLDKTLDIAEASSRDGVKQGTTDNNYDITTDTTSITDSDTEDSENTLLKTIVVEQVTEEGTKERETTKLKETIVFESTELVTVTQGDSTRGLVAQAFEGVKQLFGKNKEKDSEKWQLTNQDFRDDNEDTEIKTILGEFGRLSHETGDAGNTLTVNEKESTDTGIHTRNKTEWKSTDLSSPSRSLPVTPVGSIAGTSLRRGSNGGEELISVYTVPETIFKGPRTISRTLEEANKEEEPKTDRLKYHSAESDSEGEEDMAYTTPVVFRGTSSENAENWLRHATWWLSTTRAGQGPDLKLKLHQIAVLLQEEAQNWFARIRLGRRPTSESALDRGQQRETLQLTGTAEDIYINSWEEFEEAFLDRFRRNPTDRVGDIAALMQMQQSPSQTVEDFVLSIRRQGALVSASEAEMYLAAITGLRPELKAQIMQFDPTNLDEVTKRGKIAERYPINRNAIAGTPQVRDQSQGKLDQILLALNELNNIREPEIDQRQRSSTPPRVRFMNQENDRSQQRSRSAEAPAWNERGTQGMERNNRSFSPVPSQNRERQSRFDENNFSRGAYRGGGNRGNGGINRGGRQQYGGNNFDNNTREYCSRCGGGHGRMRMCPATGATCHGCGRPNHFKRCCRSSRGAQGGYGNESRGRYSQPSRPYRD